MSTALAVTRETALSEDGFVYDVETGEVVGLAAESESGKFFQIETPEHADWVLGLLMVEEAAIAAIEARRAAINANLDSMLVRPRGRLDFLHFRFDVQLTSQARRDIEAAGGKTKTAKYPHGRISFRAAPAKAEITDAGGALSFVMDWAPDLVKMSVGPTDVLKAIEARRDAGFEDDSIPFARIIGPRDVPSVKTGIPDLSPAKKED